MSVSPHDKNNCPICEEEISGSKLISNRIGPREKFYCPGCESVMTYSIIQKQYGTELLLHHAGDPKKQYGDDAQDMAEDENKPIVMKKTIVVMSAKAYLTKEMETRSGKILPEGSPVTILNVNMKGNQTEVVFEDSSLSQLPAVSVPKRNLLLSLEEIDSDMAFRLMGVSPEASVDQILQPIYNEGE
jgi:hypothetical protein